MEFLEKLAENCFLLYLKIKPNSKKLYIMENGKYLTFHLLSKPVKNKANKELVNILRKKLDLPSTHIKIVSGLKSTNKIIQLNFLKKTNEKDIIKKLIN